MSSPSCRGELLDTAELDELAAALELLAQQLITARDGAEPGSPGGNGPSIEIETPTGERGECQTRDVMLGPDQ